jgi:hypothetical protein
MVSSVIKTSFGISNSFTSVQLDTFLKPQALGTFFTIIGVLLVKIVLLAI